MNDPFLSAYAFEKRFHLPRLRHAIMEAEKAYQDIKPVTIDWCKSIIESMCRQILQEKDPAYVDDEKADLPKLIKKALEKVGISNDQLRGGISSLVSAVAQIRNDETVAGHGLMGSKPLIGETEIHLYVSTFEHLSRIFLILIQHEEPGIRHTTMAFKELEELLGLEDFNRQTDGSVSVQYDQEEGTLFIEGKEIRPSEILYHFDRETYAVKIQNAQQEATQREEEELAERLHEQAMAEIDHHLCEEGVFDDFHPGHYGYELPDIWIDEIKVNKDEGTATATGTVETTARLGSSREEDGIDINYSSGFTALFVLLVSEETGITGLELEELRLDTVDWYQHEPDDYDYPDVPTDDLEPDDPESAPF